MVLTLYSQIVNKCTTYLNSQELCVLYLWDSYDLTVNSDYFLKQR